jgi:hypothetical protein
LAISGIIAPVIAGFVAGIILIAAFAIFSANLPALSSMNLVNPNNQNSTVTTSTSGFNQHQLLFIYKNEILQLTAKTDDNRTRYQYGAMVPLNITLFNASNRYLYVTSKDMKPYAGLAHECANETYFDFVVLQGTYSNISSYNDLLKLKDKAIYVQDPPFLAHSCFFPYIQKIDAATIKPFAGNGNGDSKFRIYYTDKEGSHNTRDVHTFPTLDYIKNEYIEHIDKTTGKIYAVVEPLPAGRYTIVGFTLSGQISNPLVIQIKSP